MKRIFALLIMALMVAILLPSCTENQRAKRFGGKMEYQVPKGEEFVNATWKDNNLWVITKNQTTGTFYMHEVSDYGVLEGTVVITP